MKNKSSGMEKRKVRSEHKMMPEKQEALVTPSGSPTRKLSNFNSSEFDAAQELEWPDELSASDKSETSKSQSFIPLLPLAISGIKKSATDLIEHLWKLQLHTELPGWRRDNEYLVANHRPNLSTINGCLTSIFKFHSETMNIWTHLIGFFALLVYYPMLTNKKESEVIPRHEMIVLNIHAAMGMLCFFFSTAFHVLECHSPAIHELFARLDHFGIAGLIWASKLAWIKCSSLNRDPKLDATLFLGANIICAISITMQFSGYFSRPAQRNFRTSWFIASAAIFVVIPLADILRNNGLKVAVDVAKIDLFILSILSILGGCLFYLLHVPERFFPGSCDIFLQGHTLLHLFVNVTIFLQVYAFRESAINRANWEAAHRRSWN